MVGNGRYLPTGEFILTRSQRTFFSSLFCFTHRKQNQLSGEELACIYLYVLKGTCSFLYNALSQAGGSRSARRAPGGAARFRGQPGRCACACPVSAIT